MFATDNDTPVSILPTCTSTYTLHDIKATEIEVLTILNSLDVNKAAGINNISAKVLRYCALPLLKPICHLPYNSYFIVHTKTLRGKVHLS